MQTAPDRVGDKRWLVTWTIDMWAPDEITAAAQAWEAMRRPGSIANVFQVQQWGLGATLVDLDELPCENCGQRIRWEGVIAGWVSISYDPTDADYADDSMCLEGMQHRPDPREARSATDG